MSRSAAPVGDVPADAVYGRAVRRSRAARRAEAERDGGPGAVLQDVRLLVRVDREREDEVVRIETVGGETELHVAELDFFADCFVTFS